jgi:hypothetical protein
MRLAVYGSVSSILAIGVVLSAMLQRSNFYAACIYLSKSSACMMVNIRTKVRNQNVDSIIDFIKHGLDNFGIIW